MTCELYFSETVIKKKSHGPKYYARHFDKFRSLEGFFFFLAQLLGTTNMPVD